MTVVEYEVRDAVASIRLNRPERLNAVTPELIEALVAALERALADQVGAVVLSGNGRAFCAGHDLRDNASSPAADEVWRDVHRIQDVTRLVRRMPCPVIASVHGYALGAGCEFALCSDLVVAAESAQFGFPEVSVGLSVTGGISHVLPLAVGLARAKELLLVGERFSAGTGQSWNLVNHVVPEAELEDRTWALAAQVAGRPRLAMALAKQALDGGPGAPLESALITEIHHAQLAMASPEAASGADAFRGSGGRSPQHQKA